jgi:two-component system, response regulator PdtaR
MIGAHRMSPALRGGRGWDAAVVYASSPDPAAAVAPRILIVDDDFFITMESEMTLREAGFVVVGTAATAEDAVRLAEQHRPDLVLMDIRLAGPRDGVAAACELRESFGIPSLYVTAHSDPQTRARGDRAQPLGWLEKPFSGPRLLQAVKAALKRLEG